MLKDYTLGEHLLLMGNQGVGKNKLTDHLLQIMKREREYIQLHRDTTVPALTLTPTLVDGRVVWEDSPLVKALTNGRCESHGILTGEARHTATLTDSPCAGS